MENFAIIGLGNPGQVYQKTRHNLGFWLVDAIAERENLVFQSSKDFHADHLVMSRKNNRILLVKPKTFMNESGKYLSKILSYFRCPPENVVLVHDELTLPFGELKISQNSESLETFTLSEERSSVEFKLDRRVFNMGDDIDKGLGTLEVLNDVPSVNVDIEGNITLRGNSGVQILIDVPF